MTKLVNSRFGQLAWLLAWSLDVFFFGVMIKIHLIWDERISKNISMASNTFQYSCYWCLYLHLYTMPLSDQKVSVPSFYKLSLQREGEQRNNEETQCPILACLSLKKKDFNHLWEKQVMAANAPFIIGTQDSGPWVPQSPPQTKKWPTPWQGMKKLSHIDAIDHTLTTGKFSQTSGSQVFELSIHSLFRSEKKKVCGFLCHGEALGEFYAFLGMPSSTNQVRTSFGQVCLSRRWAAKRVRSQSGALQHQSKPLWSQGHWEGSSRETVRFLRGYGQQNGK